MKYLKFVFAASVFLMASGQASAQYGMAGCGLGSIVANEMDWGNDIMQVLAATTNGTAGSQTFGITFGTSNCGGAASPKMKEKAKGKGKKRAEQKVYLHYNMAHIKADAARGEGDYIAGLAGLFGCQNQLTGNYDEFATVSQRHHSEIFGATEADGVLANYERVLATENLACAQG